LKPVNVHDTIAPVPFCWCGQALIRSTSSGGAGHGAVMGGQPTPICHDFDLLNRLRCRWPQALDGQPPAGLTLR